MNEPALTELFATIKSTGRPMFFEVSPLFETEWTGIPMVAAGLAGTLDESFHGQVQFCYADRQVPASLVRQALARGGGAQLRHAWTKLGNGWNCVPDGLAQHAIALFPTVKPVRGRFAIEASLFHDLSTIITPQFHQAENIRHHVATLLADRATNAVSFAVSQATADDLAAYLGDDGRTFVVGNGYAWPSGFAVRAAKLAEPEIRTPYFLVLGTREPRKNLDCLFAALRRFPQLLETTKIVIAGKLGWHMAQDESDPVIRRAIAEGKIVFAGYVSEFRKYCLLKHAIALIYPSLFEGFGLPVVESLSLGTPCIASFAAAIPQVGGDLCTYFDPFSPDSLCAAMKSVLAATERPDPEAAARRRDYAAGHNWPAMLARMLGPVCKLLVA